MPGQQKKNAEKCVQLRQLSAKKRRKIEEKRIDKFICNRTHTHQATTPTSISPHKALRELNEPAFNNLSAAVKIKTPYGEPDPETEPEPEP